MERDIIYRPVHLDINSNPDNNAILLEETDSYRFKPAPGIQIGGKHYGFFITYEDRETKLYPTENRVTYITEEEGIIKICEENRSKVWQFDEQGNEIKTIEKDKEKVLVK